MEADRLAAFRPCSQAQRRAGSLSRPALRLSAALVFTGIGTAPAFAQGISLLRDTETEDMLKSYEAPLAQAAGLDPDAAQVWLVGDPDVNAFAALATAARTSSSSAGILLWLQNAQ